MKSKSFWWKVSFYFVMAFIVVYLGIFLGYGNEQISFDCGIYLKPVGRIYQYALFAAPCWSGWVCLWHVYCFGSCSSGASGYVYWRWIWCFVHICVWCRAICYRTYFSDMLSFSEYVVCVGFPCSGHYRFCSGSHTFGKGLIPKALIKKLPVVFAARSFLLSWY